VSYVVELQNVVENIFVPQATDFEKWVALVLQRAPFEKGGRLAQRDGGFFNHGELTIRIVEEQESASLNKQYRKKNGPTNVLSFPFVMENPLPPELSELNYVGDLVICAAVISREAKEQNKDLQAHWAHIVIHGCLHLLGYDHVKKEDALVMENIEIQLLQQLNYPNPYVEAAQHE
jgi:probable rRNA maturation factor